ncbi:MAG: hypothetical protein GEV11_27350 [Streptosporangiales bacterium]|nr:hypothetical protein [Streptosporangiales bacterium]
MKGMDIYLNDHLAGATAGLELARRVARARHEAELDRLVEEIAADRDALLEIMRVLRVPKRPVKQYAAMLGERIARLKPNGRLLHRSPVSDVVELEAMRLAIDGKAAGWRALRRLAEQDDRLDAERLDALMARAREQAEFVEGLRLDAVGTLLPRQVNDGPGRP